MWLLRGGLVLAAFFLGLSLNTFTFREPFRSFQADRTGETARQGQAGEEASGAREAGRQPAPDAPPGDRAMIAERSGADGQPAAGRGSPPAPVENGAGEEAAQPAATGEALGAAAGRAATGIRDGAQADPGTAADAGQVSGARAPEDSKASGTGRSSGHGALGGDAAQDGKASVAGRGDEEAAATEQAAGQAQTDGKPSFVEGPTDGTAALVPPRVESSPESLRAAGVGRRVALATGSGQGREEAGSDVQASLAGEAAASAKEDASPGHGDQVHGQVVPPGPGGRVVEIATEDRPDEFVLIVSIEGQAERVTTFAAKEPPRLAVDLWGTWKFSGPTVRAIVDGLMDRVRIGAHPDRLRLVVDYRDKAIGKTPEAVVEKRPGVVVIRVPKPR